MKKLGSGWGRMQWRYRFEFFFLERDFSLRFREIRPSKFFGARKKVALRIEAYTWAPVLGVFGKLYEVGVSSYLFYS